MKFTPKKLFEYATLIKTKEDTYTISRFLEVYPDVYEWQYLPCVYEFKFDMLYLEEEKIDYNPSENKYIQKWSWYSGNSAKFLSEKNNKLCWKRKTDKEDGIILFDSIEDALELLQKNERGQFYILPTDNQ